MFRDMMAIVVRLTEDPWTACICDSMCPGWTQQRGQSCALPLAGGTAAPCSRQAVCWLSVGARWCCNAASSAGIVPADSANTLSLSYCFLMLALRSPLLPQVSLYVLAGGQKRRAGQVWGHTTGPQQSAHRREAEPCICVAMHIIHAVPGLPRIAWTWVTAARLLCSHTAAHCVDSAFGGTTNYRVLCGACNITNTTGADVMGVTGYAVHPGFSVTSSSSGAFGLTNDIALLWVSGCLLAGMACWQLSSTSACCVAAAVQARFTCCVGWCL